MDLTDQIEAYIEVKGYSPNTRNSHRSILRDFNIWQMHRPSMTMSDKANEYGRFLRENCFRKPKTVDKQLGVVRRFCDWLRETGRVDAFRLDEQLIGRPEMQSVPEPPIGTDEVAKMLNVAAMRGGEIALRDSAMMLLAVTCGLTASEISSLNIGDINTFNSGDDMHYCGEVVEIPRLAGLMLRWYTRDRTDMYGSSPLFTAEPDESAERLTPKQVEARISSLLDVVGCSYEDAVPGDCQLRIAQSFKVLDESERRRAALSVQSMRYDIRKMPHGIIRDLRDRMFPSDHDRPKLMTDSTYRTIR